jgi:hypothetical protein
MRRLRVQITSGSPVCGGEVPICEYLPHINSLFVDLRTEHVLKSDTDWTQRSPHCTWCACCCETGVASWRA